MNDAMGQFRTRALQESSGLVHCKRGGVRWATDLQGSRSAGVSTNGRLDMAREGGYWEVDVAVDHASYVGTIEGAASIMTVLVDAAGGRRCR